MSFASDSKDYLARRAKKVIFYASALATLVAAFVALEQLGITYHYGWRAAQYVENTRIMVLQQILNNLKFERIQNRTAQGDYRDQGKTIPDWLLEDGIELEGQILHYEAQLANLLEKADG